MKPFNRNLFNVIFLKYFSHEIFCDSRCIYSCTYKTCFLTINPVQQLQLLHLNVFFVSNKQKQSILKNYTFPNMPKKFKAKVVGNMKWSHAADGFSRVVPPASRGFENYVFVACPKNKTRDVESIQTCFLYYTMQIQRAHLNGCNMFKMKLTNMWQGQNTDVPLLLPYFVDNGFYIATNLGANQLCNRPNLCALSKDCIILTKPHSHVLVGPEH